MDNGYIAWAARFLFFCYLINPAFAFERGQGLQSLPAESTVKFLKEVVIPANRTELEVARTFPLVKISDQDKEVRVVTVLLFDRFPNERRIPMNRVFVVQEVKDDKIVFKGESRLVLSIGIFQQGGKRSWDKLNILTADTISEFTDGTVEVSEIPVPVDF